MKLRRVSTFQKASVTVSIKTLDVEQCVESGEKATRIFCRAMIRLYLEESGGRDNGESLGVL
jgi:hypothetical protein